MKKRWTFVPLAVLALAVIGAAVVLADSLNKPMVSLISGPVVQPGEYVENDPPVMGSGYSQFSSLSYDGRFAAFESKATNLGSATNGRYYNLYVLDRYFQYNADAEEPPVYPTPAAGDPPMDDKADDDGMARITNAWNGGEPDNHSSYPVLWREQPRWVEQQGGGYVRADKDGKFVVFQSLASNLIENDSNGKMDVFYKYLDGGEITRISEPNNTDNGEANGNSGGPLPYALDPNGDYNKIPVNLNKLNHPLHPGADLYLDSDANPFVVFESTATNIGALRYDDDSQSWVYPDPAKLIGSDGGPIQQIYLRDVKGVYNPDPASDPVFNPIPTTLLLSQKPYPNEIANDDCTQPALSLNGRFVAYTSRATNLIAGNLTYASGSDGKRYTQVYLLDRDFDNDGVFDEFTTYNATKLYLLSTTGSGQPGNGDSEYPTIGLIRSGDDYKVRVAFHSFATDLSTLKSDADTNGSADIFMAQITPGSNIVSKERISRDVDDNEGNLDSIAPALSSNGRILTFTSYASNLVAGDTNFYCYYPLVNRTYENCPDIYARDLNYDALADVLNGPIWRVSLTADGRQGKRAATLTRLSGDGRYASMATTANLSTDGEVALLYVDPNDNQTKEAQEVFGRDQGDAPGSPVIQPSYGDFFAYTGQIAEKTFTFTFLKETTVSDVTFDSESGGFTDWENSCAPDHSQKTFSAYESCRVTVRYTRSGSDYDVKQARLVVILPDDPRGQVTVNLRGYAISGFVPLIVP